MHRDREKECGWGTKGWAVWAGKANPVQEGFYPGGRAAGEAKASRGTVLTGPGPLHWEP